MIADLGKVSTSAGDAKTLEPTHDDISNSIRAIAAINPSSTNGGSTSDVKPPELELAQEVGSQVASSANLLAVDTEVVERLLDPAENELQNVVKLFQRKVVRYRNLPGDERADFQQYDPEGQAITTRWVWA
jgi:hypothetical protein